MGDLTWQEKRSLEKILQMGSGYVLDFSNRTFQEFVVDCTGRDIFAEEYAYDSGSKANRLRAFWKNEPNQLVGKLIRALLDYQATLDSRIDDPALYRACCKIVDRLVSEAKPANPDSGAKPGASKSSISTECEYEFFLAHAGPDLAPAEELFELLACRARVFLDARCLLPGNNWNNALTHAQKNSLITVVLISSRSDSAYYQSEEIATAIALARENPQTHRVVPVYLEPVQDVPYGLRIKHCVSVPQNGGMSGVSAKLLELLAALGRSRAETIEPGQPGAKTRSVTAAPKNGPAGQSEPIGSSFIMCSRCGRIPGAKGTCVGKWYEHDFRRFDGTPSTIFCARCGGGPGEKSVCIGSHYEHEFQQFKVSGCEIHCKRCGKQPARERHVSASTMNMTSKCFRTGGPLKPGFGLSGAVLPLDKVFPPLVRVLVSVRLDLYTSVSAGCVMAKTVPLRHKVPFDKLRAGSPLPRSSPSR